VDECKPLPAGTASAVRRTSAPYANVRGASDDADTPTTVTDGSTAADFVTATSATPRCSKKLVTWSVKVYDVPSLM